MTLLQYDEESNQLVDIVNYSHPGQVWVTEPSSNDASLFITSAQYLSGTKGVQLLKMTSLPDSDMDIANRKLAYKEEKAPLETMASFNFRDSSTFVNAIKWHSTKDIVLTSDPKHLSSWAITESDVQVCFPVVMGYMLFYLCNNLLLIISCTVISQSRYFFDHCQR